MTKVISKYKKAKIFTKPLSQKTLHPRRLTDRKYESSLWERVLPTAPYSILITLFSSWFDSQCFLLYFHPDLISNDLRVLWERKIMRTESFIQWCHAQCSIRNKTRIHTNTHKTNLRDSILFFKQTWQNAFYILWLLFLQLYRPLCLLLQTGDNSYIFFY